MPFTYRYATEDPPAPFVLVVLTCLDGTGATGELPAKVDTGADQTVIPSALAEQLALREVARIRFGGLGGHETELPIYEVRLMSVTWRRSRSRSQRVRANRTFFWGATC